VIALGGALLIASLVAFGFTGRGLVGAVFCPVLVLLATIDFEYHLLPNDIIGPASLVVGVIVLIASPSAFLTHLAAGAALGFFFLAFALIFRGSLGIGDAKLGFLLGLALGSRTFTGVLVAFAGLLVAALAVLARQGLSARKQALAFGPYLAIGGIVAFFFG
jgi:prepilin signal peptidase PulO-like enzyme (type II secretory pathway)